MWRSNTFRIAEAGMARSPGARPMPSGPADPGEAPRWRRAISVARVRALVGAVGQLVGRTFLWLAGWRVEGGVPAVPKAVCIAAPHTSNWDMPFMMACALSLRIWPAWVGKEALFKWPWGWFMRWMGGVPVDRRGQQNMVQAIAELFDSRERLLLGIAPAGTRSRTDCWRSGFYHVASLAKVPVVFGFLDYGRKVCGLGPLLVLTDSVDADMDYIRAFYDPIQGRHPERKSAILLAEEVARHAPPAAQTAGCGADHRGC